MTPSISIIIPIYNVEKYLPRCLDSVLDQYFFDWECILVDDGSIDLSGFICDEYASRDSRFRVIHKSNGGVSSARNEGLNNAKGEFVCFIDSDDWVGPKYLEHLYNAMIEDDSDLAIAGLVKYDSEQTTRTFRYDNDVLEISRYADIFLKHSLYTNGGPFSRLYKKEIIDKSVKFDTMIHLGEDTVFLFNYICHTKKISFVSAVDYYYNFTPGSLVSRINSYESEWRGLKELYKVLDYLRNNYIGEEAYGRCMMYYHFFMDRVVTAIYHDFPNHKDRINKLRLIDWNLYKKYGQTYSWQDRYLKKLLINRCFLAYDFAVWIIKKKNKFKIQNSIK